MLRGTTRVRLNAGVAVAVALGAALVFQAVAQPRFPALTGRIVDEAGLLSGGDKASLEGELEALEQKSTDQLVVYTARSLQGYEIEDFGYQLGRAWALGRKEKNNGVILIVAPKERKVRIEVGRGLEPQLTDAMTKLIIENAILPAFRRGDFPAGIKAGVHDIRNVLLGDAEAVKQRARSSVPRSSGGTEALRWRFSSSSYCSPSLWSGCRRRKPRTLAVSVSTAAAGGLVGSPPTGEAVPAAGGVEGAPAVAGGSRAEGAILAAAEHLAAGRNASKGGRHGPCN
jgi:uncharacterized membrane protein YgcG